ncbi:hypothetical protein ACO1LX_19630, partial [Staphylococcus aureus]
MTPRERLGGKEERVANAPRLRGPTESALTPEKGVLVRLELDRFALKSTKRGDESRLGRKPRREFLLASLNYSKHE